MSNGAPNKITLTSSDGVDIAVGKLTWRSGLLTSWTVRNLWANVPRIQIGMLRSGQF